MPFPTSLTNAVDDVTIATAAHINNLEKKVGIDGSSDLASLDYGLRNVLSVDPGHRHIIAAVDLGYIIPAGTPSLSNLVAADALAYSLDQQLLVPPGTWDVDDDATLTSLVKVMPGANLVVGSTKTLAFSNQVEAGRFSIFSGAGNVAIGGKVYPEWFGSGLDAFQWMINSCRNAIIDFDPSATYNSNPVTVPHSFSGTIVEGHYGTWKCTATGLAGILLTAATLSYVTGGLTYYPMAANYAVGDVDITLSSGIANFHVGDYIYVRQGPAPVPIAEINKIFAINGSVITLQWPLSKDYANDGINTFGVTPFTDQVIENVTFKNVVFDTVVRPSNLNNCVNVWFESCIVKSDGGFILRGRGLKWIDNRIEIVPSWNFSNLTRPYFYGADTGSCDIEATGNKCVSTGIGIVHLHEGCSNVDNHDNLYQCGQIDPGVVLDYSYFGARWAVLSHQGYGWDIKAHDNIIVNSPSSDGILFAYGFKNCQAYNNILVGAFGRDGIREINNNSKMAITGNDLSAATCVGKYLNSDSADSVIKDNNLPLGAAVTISTWHEQVRWNYGMGQCEYYLLPCESFIAEVGTPELVDCRGGGKNKAMAFDGAASEAIERTWVVPTGVYHLGAEFFWTNGGASAGSVTWIVYLHAWTPGDDLTSSDPAYGGGTYVAPVQNILALNGSTASIIDVTPGQLVTIRVLRDPTNVGDTLANDAWFIGLRLRSIP